MTLSLPQSFFCRLNRGILRLGGEDRRTFLQGIISNDITLCQTERPLYAALLTPQGKFLHDMFIIDKGDHFLIDCEYDRTDDLLKRLLFYKLRAQIVLEKATNLYTVWALWGDFIKDQTAFTDPRLMELGKRMVTHKDYQPPAPEVSIDDYDRHRLTYGIPDGSRDMIIGKSTLLECNLDKLNAISWSKGCYMGQELTARMYYRGLLKKRLYSVTIDNPIESETEIKLENETIGIMASSSGSKGLALMNIEKTEKAIHERLILTANTTHISPSRQEWM